MKNVNVTIPAVSTVGWLYTIGFAKLTFWQGVLAMAIWPYYLGAAVAS